MAADLAPYLDLAHLHAEIIITRAEIAALQLQLVAGRVVRWAIANPDEAAGAATGLLGAFLLARRGKYAPLGWLAFLASNIALIAFAWRNNHPGLLTLQLCFVATSLLGLWTHLDLPPTLWAACEGLRWRLHQLADLFIEGARCPAMRRRDRARFTIANALDKLALALYRMERRIKSP